MVFWSLLNTLDHTRTSPPFTYTALFIYYSSCWKPSSTQHQRRVCFHRNRRCLWFVFETVMFNFVTPLSTGQGLCLKRWCFVDFLDTVIVLLPHSPRIAELQEQYIWWYCFSHTIFLLTLLAGPQGAGVKFPSCHSFVCWETDRFLITVVRRNAEC